MNIWLVSRLVAVTATTALVLTGCTGSGGSTDASASPSGGPGASSPSSGVPTSDAPTAPTTGVSPTPSASDRGESLPGFPGLRPLWPFITLAQAESWESRYRSGGHQPWHLDAEQTALSFTEQYLGFQDIDRVTSRAVDGREARIGVGLSGTESTGTAAVIHLVRYGTGPDAPWEVVGTDDTTFSLTEPAYGSVVRSPATVGGRITGVDESVRVEVRQPSAARPLGENCCVSAGGKDQPWQSSVSFSGATDPVLTIVASTGGHVAEVERFTVTAVRAG
ncbi:hypothetical protein AB0903_23305 [Streptomyces sp. NPDC048389]|uniref:hypothetical protein n=1 Tax=Streptomyces sp. NPDC048389 TaxID=3154622 RepID=UPI003451F24C